jgi:signal transduction histidine kinase/ligand-binding sensor domain-containing protein
MNSHHLQSSRADLATRILLLPILLIGFLPNVSGSQTIPFQTFSMRDGLLSNGVNTFFQDSQGYLWIGTRDGISVFDGWTFKNYTTFDGLPSGFIKQILEDRFTSNKTMWVLTGRGELCRVVGDTVIYFRDSTSVHKRVIHSFGQDHTGTLWVGTDSGLAKVCPGTLQFIESTAEMGLVDAICEQGDSVLWVVSRAGLFRHRFRTDAFERVDIGLSPPVNCVAGFIDENNTLWLAANNYIIQARDGLVVSKKGAPGVVFLVDDHMGKLLYGSYDGLFRLPKDRLASGTFEHFTTRNGLPENTLRCGYVDRESNLWVGGIAKGIARLTEANTLRFDIIGLNPPYQYSIAAADSNGHVWVVGPSDLFEVFEDSFGGRQLAIADDRIGRGKEPRYSDIFNLPNSAKGIIPFSLVVDRVGRLWVGYSNGQIACYQIEARVNKASRLRLIRTLRPDADFPSGFPNCFAVDRHDRVWYSAGKKLLLMDPNRTPSLLRIFGEQDGILSDRNYVRAILCDSGGNVWVGCYRSGVALLSADSIFTGSFRPFPITAKPLQPRIASLRADSHRRIWIASETDGLFLVENGRVETRSLASGMPSAIVTSSTEDHAGRVWVSTGVGVGYFDSAGSTSVHKKSDLADSYVFCSGMTRKGELWFVQINSLVIHKPSIDRAGRSLFPPIVTSFHANGVKLPLTEHVSLPYGQNNIEINFVAITFKDHKDVRYEYRLSGLDPDWSRPQTSKHVLYGAVPPGEYMFQVRAIDARGMAGEDTAQVHFSIVPPFWRTGWFMVFIWILVVLVVWGTARYIEISKFRRRMRMLENQRALENERLRISSDLHDELASNLTSIAMLSRILHDEKSTGTEPTQRQQMLERIAVLSGQSVESIRDIIWAIDPKSETLESLLTKLQDSLVSVCRAKGIHLDVDLRAEGTPSINLQPEVRRNLWFLLKEAAHNAIKHSSCSRLAITARYSSGMLWISIRDNGKGHDPSTEGSGKGRKTMDMRARQIGGILEYSAIPGQGTTVTLTVNIADRTN